MKQLVKSLFFAWLLVLPSLGVAAGPTASHPALAPATLPAATPPAKEDKGDGAITGKIVETMNSGGYTYVNLEKNGKKTWVAAAESRVKVGQEASCPSGMKMDNFTSKTLKRTFESIVFCNSPLETVGGKMDAAQKSPGSKGAKVASAEAIKVEKATGANAYTVGDI